MKKLFTLFAAVVMMALASQAGELTVADGAAQDAHYPFYGLYYDTPGTLSQMIYPSSELTELIGKKITKITFYANSPIQLTGGSLQFSMTEMDKSEYLTADPVNLGDYFVICNVTPAYDETELVLTLDEPFFYEGNSNLLIEGLVTEAGNFKSIYFQGVTTGLYCSMYQYQGWSGSWYAYTSNFLPKATFTYEDGDTPPSPSVVPVPEGINVVPADHSAYAQWDIDEDYDQVLWNLRYREYSRASEWIYDFGVETPFITIENLTPETTYELQVQAYDAYDESLESDWSESVVFTTLPEQAPQGQTASPEIVTTPGDEYYILTGQVKEGDPEAVVTLFIVDEDGNRVEVTNPFIVNRTDEDQIVEIVAVAHIDGQIDGETVITVLVPAKVITGIDEVINGKTVAGVRYYNMAGQEMQEANGMTIVVTTYTDGTTTAVKVMK